MHVCNDAIRAEDWVQDVAKSVAARMVDDLTVNIPESTAKGTEQYVADCLKQCMTAAMAKGWNLGEAEGKAKEKAKTFLKLARKKFGKVPKSRKEWLRLSTMQELDDCLRRLPKASCLDAALSYYE